MDHILRCLRAHGWTRDLPNQNFVSGKKSDIYFEEAFKFCLPGYNLRPLEMSGAIGQEQLKKLNKFINVRKMNAEKFLYIIKKYPFIKTQKEIGSSSWFGFSLVLNSDSPVSRDSLVRILNQNQIDCRPIVTGNFLKNKSLLEYFDYEIFGYHENAEIIDANGFFIGNHHVDLTEELLYLDKILNKTFRDYVE